MLIIRPEQLDALARCGEQAFAEYAVEHLHGAAGDDEARALARHALSKGRHYGLEEHYDYLRYLNLAFVLGTDFDADPGYAAILGDPGLPPRTRMGMATQRAIEAEEQELAEDLEVDIDERDDELEPEPEWEEPEPDDDWIDGPDGSEQEELVGPDRC